MRKLFLAGLLALTTFAPQLAVAAKDSDDSVGPRVISVSIHDGERNRHITLGLNKAVIVQLDAEARDVLVSNPKVVDAVIRSPHRIFLLGTGMGTTNAFFFDASGHQILSIEIAVQRDLSDLSALIRASIPDSNVRAVGANDGIALTGSVINAQDAVRAQDLATRFIADGDEKKVINMIQVRAHEQVMIKVRIAEMQRTVAKQFGINVQAADFAGNIPILASSGTGFGLVGRALSDLAGAQVGQTCANGQNPLSAGTCVVSPHGIESQLKALEDIGLVHTLAEPNLTAVSGETAKFLAGGEFPVPASRDNVGNVTVDYKDFGVGLSFTPVVLGENRISLQISTEVSELTNVGAFQLSGGQTLDSNGNIVNVAGVTLPALNVRRAQTTIELPSGGSFAIAGLLQHTTKQDLQKFPGLGDMPVLGALFRSRDFQNNETELVVMISAYLVSPVAQARLASPTDGFIPAADLDTILLGRLNTVYKRSPSAIRSAANGPIGYIVQ